MHRAALNLGGLLTTLSLATMLGLGLTSATVAQDDWPRPTAQAVRGVGNLTVDGRLDEPAWGLVQWSGGFTSASQGPENAGQPAPVAVQTRFKVLWDAARLYVAVECDEPSPEALKAAVTEHDAMVFADDCIELFLDPAGEGRYYHHFIVNSRGAWYDDLGADYGLVHNKLWEFPLEAAAQVDAAGRTWTAEIAIPVGALMLPERPQSTWLWNVTRERYAGGAPELSSWSPLKANFHAPRRFGTLTGVATDYRRFALDLGEPEVRVALEADAARSVGLQVAATNHTDAPVDVVWEAAVFGGGPRVAAPGPVRLEAGATTALPYLRLPLQSNQPELPCLLTLRDAATGDVLKAVVKRLAAVYSPIAVTVLRPCYRNCIYATEKLDSVDLRLALAPDVAQRAQAVGWRLSRPDVPAEWAGKVSPAQVPAVVRIPAADLEEGEYLLEVAAWGADGEAPLATAQQTIRKLPPPESGHEVRVDEQGNVLVDGKPFVGIGWYGSPETSDPRADVRALQNLQTPVVIMMPDVSVIRDPYATHGIWSMVSVENGRLQYSFELWRQPDHPVPTEQSRLAAPSSEMRDLLKQLVDAVRDEPGLLGYYISDEPEINNVRPDYLENQYKLLCELDPYHPVMVTNDTLDGIVTHGYKCADILGPDPYSPEYDYVPNFMKRCREVMRPGQAIVVTPWHSTSQTHFTQDWGSGPPYPYRVSRNQYLVSLAYGARGWAGYTSPFFMPEIEYRYGLPYVWREIRFLEPAMAAPVPESPVSVEADAEMARWIRSADGLVYLVVVNHKPGSRHATISHPLLAGVQKLVVVSEGREVDVRDGRFADDFAEGDARIYTTDLRGAAFSTTSQVEEELARRHAESAKPGNLLHISRGTRLTASEGYYAPWFYQYYYYAVNGITDDMGWAASHAGDKPAWFEVVLPEPATVGRVVLYTPNLRDYDLQLQGPDGTANVAQIRGNTQTIVEHSFAQPMACIKLRVTALAARQGKPQVNEIEAYEAPGAGPVTALSLRAAATAAPQTHLVALEPGVENALWSDDFSSFESRDRYYWDGRDVTWVLDPQRYQATPVAGGGLVCTSPGDGAGMSRILPYDPAYRFLQVKIGAIEGEGYRFISVNCGDPSGKPGYLGAITTNRPGIYTVDTHYIHDSFRTGSTDKCFLTTYMGAIRCTFDWMRLVQRPEDGLAVTLADGSPLPPVLKRGDEVLMHLVLADPAADATVSVLKHHDYSPLPLNGQAHVQLMRVGQGDGREWAAKVVLGEGTGTFDVAASGYPVVFRANVSGGRLRETYATAFVSFQ